MRRSVLTVAYKGECESSNQLGDITLLGPGKNSKPNFLEIHMKLIKLVWHSVKPDIYINL